LPVNPGCTSSEECCRRDGTENEKVAKGNGNGNHGRDDSLASDDSDDDDSSGANASNIFDRSPSISKNVLMRSDSKPFKSTTSTEFRKKHVDIQTPILTSVEESSRLVALETELLPSSNVFLRGKQKRVSLLSEESLGSDDTERSQVLLLPKNLLSRSREKIDLKFDSGAATAIQPKLPKTLFAQKVEKVKSGELKSLRLSKNLFVEKKGDITELIDQGAENITEAASRKSENSFTSLRLPKRLFANRRDQKPDTQSPDESKDNSTFSPLPKSLFNAKTEEVAAPPAIKQKTMSNTDNNFDEMKQPASSAFDFITSFSKNLFVPREQTTNVEAELKDSKPAQTSGLRLPTHVFSRKEKILPAPTSEEDDCDIDLYRCGRGKVQICRDGREEMCILINAFRDGDNFGCCGEDCAGPPKCHPRQPPRRYLR